MRSSTPGGEPAQLGDQPGQDDRPRVGVGGDGEAALGGRRVELRVGERGLQLGQAAVQAARDGARAGGGDHAVGSFDEQLVAEPVAQPAQRVAHCGLAEAQPQPGAGDAALLVQRVEHEQQVEVDRGQPRLRLLRARQLAPVCMSFMRRVSTYHWTHSNLTPIFLRRLRR